MIEFSETICDCVEHDGVNTQAYGFKIKTISNPITTPKANSVMIFQTNAHVDARTVVVQHTKISSIENKIILSSNEFYR